MVDFHTHILPEIDDGAKDVETARAMMEAEKANGVDTVLLTSHYYAKKRSPDQFVQKRAESFAAIKDLIPDGLTVKLAAEVHLKGYSGAAFEDVCKLAIEGTRYILIELPFTTKWTERLLQKLEDFIRETDYTPVLAHVERYAEVQKRPAFLQTFINMGCLLQVNCGAFLERRTRSLAFAMLKKGYVHALGTDAHNLDSRSCDYAAAKAEIEGRGYAAEFGRTQKNMRHILADESVKVGRPKKIKKFFGRYF